MRNYLRNLKNRKGNILIVSYLIIVLLLIFAGTFISRAFIEIRAAMRFEDSARAFQAAEAMIEDTYWRLDHGMMLLKNPINLATNTISQLNEIEETMSTKTIITTGTSGASGDSSKDTQKILAQTVVNTKYENALTAGRDLELTSIAITGGPLPFPSPRGTLIVNGRIVLSGDVVYTNPNAKLITDDLREKANPILTRIIFVDPNHDGVVAQSEFLDYADELVLRLQAEDPRKVAVIQQGAGIRDIRVNTFPSETKLIFVRRGIIIDPRETWVNLGGAMRDEDLTVISDGKIFNAVTNSASGENQQLLNIISYGDFTQTPMPSQRPELNYKIVVTTFSDAIIQSPVKMTATNIGAQNNIKIAFVAADSRIEITFCDDLLKGKIPVGLNEAVAEGSLIAPFSVEFDDNPVGVVGEIPAPIPLSAGVEWPAQTGDEAVLWRRANTEWREGNIAITTPQPQGSGD